MTQLVCSSYFLAPATTSSLEKRGDWIRCSRPQCLLTPCWPLSVEGETGSQVSALCAQVACTTTLGHPGGLRRRPIKQIPIFFFVSAKRLAMIRCWDGVKREESEIGLHSSDPFGDCNGSCRVTRLLPLSVFDRLLPYPRTLLRAKATGLGKESVMVSYI